jgi:hypothetical protein
VQFRILEIIKLHRDEWGKEKKLCLVFPHKVRNLKIVGIDVMCGKNWIREFHSWDSEGNIHPAAASLVQPHYLQLAWRAGRCFLTAAVSYSEKEE